MEKRMKKTLATLALALTFTGGAHAQLLLLGDGSFLTATTVFSIDAARKQAALERQKKDEIRKKREENRKKSLVAMSKDTKEEQKTVTQ